MKSIDDYINWLHQTMDNDLALKEAHDIKFGKYGLEQVEILLIQERAEVEMILAGEVRGWEQKLREHLIGFFVNDGMEPTTRAELDKRWRADLWERLEVSDDSKNSCCRALHFKKSYR